eukprot:TRINITY_DN2417_c0_g1_i1.p1 TRINITY_DN2417_c0_g1~~TRINITY_DN2417_c0_g1_i1.p1  ORF type:complete len:347 (+),score=33.24 TRINITY_DN2417_c0_g1_i1:358-1398(+)
MALDIKPEEVDIVIPAIEPDLSFLEQWRPFIASYHLIIVQDPDLEGGLKIPSDFTYTLYSKHDIEKTLGSQALQTLGFRGLGCRYFGYLSSKKKYIISFDQDCVPAKDPEGNFINAVEQHLLNLKAPSTPTFFNTLYDPYRPGSDFVRGYPFSLRQGVPSAVSCGLWLNFPDYDTATLAKKPNEKNTRYVDAVLTVPNGAMFPMSSINIAFNREIIGPAMFSPFVNNSPLPRHGTLEDIWCGLCCKLICDHLGFGMKTGLPYVWRKDLSEPISSGLQVDPKREKFLEGIFPFFQSLRLPRSAFTVEDCFLEIGKQAKEKLKDVDPSFSEMGPAMEAWIQAWKSVQV